MSEKMREESFENQVDNDQKRYSRYVCDSRAIPNEIDGLKPVQRRILWTMWNSVAKNTFTKTVKVAGLVMGYHPHGDASIQDAISAMAQDFTFANNYTLISGEGTFGDVLDPKAIASPRYTEVKLSDFSKDAGIFDSIPDIDYAPNYDETSKEPVFFVPKIPLVLLNPISGIATGFRTSMHGHRLTDTVKSMVKYLKTGKAQKVTPWYAGFLGYSDYARNDNGVMIFTTGFGFKTVNGSLFLTDAPQGWNREKVIDYLDQILSEKENTELKNYIDHSSDCFHIELVPRKGTVLTPAMARKILNKCTNEIEVPNVINSEGRLASEKTDEIIARFCNYRKKHLIRRFKRLSEIEKEKIERNSELIRFIKEGWNTKVVSVKNKADLEKRLKGAKYVFFEWLSGIPIYRMTVEEASKCKDAIAEAKKQYAYYQQLVKTDSKLIDFIIQEINELAVKWDKKAV